MNKLQLLIFWGLLFFTQILSADNQIPYTVYLKEGTLLEGVKDHQIKALSKGIYAKVLELNPNRRDQFYVYNNEGNAQYLTGAEGVVEIEDDIQLLPKINAAKIYPPKDVFKASDQVAQFESQLNIHFDNMQVSTFNSIYSDLIPNVITTRYEARTLYVSTLPFEFGFGVNYQSAYWENDFEQIKISILSFGPQFKYSFYHSDNFVAHALLGAEVAPLYEGVTSTFTDKYTAQLFDLGIESEWLSPLGILTLGSHFRRHEVSLSQSDRINLQEVPREFAVNSLGVMLGYKLEWEL